MEGTWKLTDMFCEHRRNSGEYTDFEEVQRARRFEACRTITVTQHDHESACRLSAAKVKSRPDVLLNGSALGSAVDAVSDWLQQQRKACTRALLPRCLLVRLNSGVYYLEYVVQRYVTKRIHT